MNATLRACYSGTARFASREEMCEEMRPYVYLRNIRQRCVRKTMETLMAPVRNSASSDFSSSRDDSSSDRGGPTCSWEVNLNAIDIVFKYLRMRVFARVSTTTYILIAKQIDRNESRVSSFSSNNVRAVFESSQRIIRLFDRSLEHKLVTIRRDQLGTVL